MTTATKSHTNPNVFAFIANVKIVVPKHAFVIIKPAVIIVDFFFAGSGIVAIIKLESRFNVLYKVGLVDTGFLSEDSLNSGRVSGCKGWKG